MRACADCGADISGRGRAAKRCAPCALMHNLADKRAGYAANPDKYKAWRRANPERVRDNHRAWRRANPEKRRAQLQRYAEKHPDKIRANARERNARKRNQSGVVLPYVEAYLLGLQRSRCAAPNCNAGLPPFHLDHIIPLSRGGLHDNSNLQLLCPPCNLSKSAKAPEDWLMEKGMLPLMPHKT